MMHLEFYILTTAYKILYIYRNVNVYVTMCYKYIMDASTYTPLMLWICFMHILCHAAPGVCPAFFSSSNTPFRTSTPFHQQFLQITFVAISKWAWVFLVQSILTAWYSVFHWDSEVDPKLLSATITRTHCWPFISINGVVVTFLKVRTIDLFLQCTYIVMVAFNNAASLCRCLSKRCIL
jgi:hypothetical protein